MNSGCRAVQFTHEGHRSRAGSRVSWLKLALDGEGAVVWVYSWALHSPEGAENGAPERQTDGWTDG